MRAACVAICQGPPPDFKLPSSIKSRFAMCEANASNWSVTQTGWECGDSDSAPGCKSGGAQTYSQNVGRAHMADFELAFAVPMGLEGGYPTIPSPPGGWPTGKYFAASTPLGPAGMSTTWPSATESTLTASRSIRRSIRMCTFSTGSIRDRSVMLLDDTPASQSQINCSTRPSTLGGERSVFFLQCSLNAICRNGTLFKELSRRQSRRVTLASCKRLNPGAVSIVFLWQPSCKVCTPSNASENPQPRRRSLTAGQLCIA